MKTIRVLPVDHPASGASWKAFAAAPHRVMFAGGALQGVLTVAWWLAELLGRSGTLAQVAWTIPPTWAHMFLMAYGFFPFFIFGFLMTAMPSWLGRAPIKRPVYLGAFLGLASGMAMFYAGLAFSRTLSAAGALVVAGGWIVAARGLGRLLRGDEPQDLRHARVAALAVAAGALGAVLFAWGIAATEARLVEAARQVGLWLFLAPVFITVSHRMIPFFTSRAVPGARMVRPWWTLWVLLAGAVAHGALEFAGAQRWLWIPDLVALGASLHLTHLWGLRAALAVRLVAVLHIGFAMLSLALALYAAQSLWLLTTGDSILGLAPLHVLTIGYFSAMVLGMASRVTLGHSGQPLVADTLTWTCFLGLVATALARAAAELPGLPGGAAPWIVVGSALLWLAALMPWVARYLPVYLRPRPDGKAG